MTRDFCPSCGGADFCLPTCVLSTPEMQYYQRTVWHLQFMATCARSPERQQYWADQCATARARLADAETQLLETRFAVISGEVLAVVR